jgi:hypothetical protein
MPNRTTGALSPRMSVKETKMTAHTSKPTRQGMQEQRLFAFSLLFPPFSATLYTGSAEEVSKAEKSPPCQGFSVLNQLSHQKGSLKTFEPLLLV